AYQYFSIIINNQVYHFVPTEAKEIRINRKTKKIVNVDDIFAFQKGKELIHIAMADLISLPDFLIQLHFIVESYYAQGKMESKDHQQMNNENVILELERMNLLRMIDKTLDERDEEAFYQLVKQL